MWIAIAAFAGLLGLINLVQVFIGRQLIRPSASRRSPLEIRRQSAAAAVAMLGVSLVGLRVFWGVLFMLFGYVALVIVRKRAPKR
ncbi:hypothetical protein ACIRRH_05425 [Kitasatospora sp. NPDC101235]|uniref:hypothetical protein n=1 Tax=Kitasatospora sp. NPDC101235 TaxID=3364101 RepID=UPI0038188864